MTACRAATFSIRDPLAETKLRSVLRTA
jgi:hypothetical protein